MVFKSTQIINLWNTGLETQVENAPKFITPPPIPHPRDFIWKFFVKLVLHRYKIVQV